MYLSNSGLNIFLRSPSILFVFFVMMLSGCASGLAVALHDDRSGRQEKVMDTRKTTILVKVISSEFDVSHDDFNDGSWDTRYITKVEIVHPFKHKGGELTITHRDPPVGGSIWVERGRRIQLEVENYILDHQELMIPVESIFISAEE